MLTFCIIRLYAKQILQFLNSGLVKHFFVGSLHDNTSTMNFQPCLFTLRNRDQNQVSKAFNIPKTLNKGLPRPGGIAEELCHHRGSSSNLETADGHQESLSKSSSCSLHSTPSIPSLSSIPPTRGTCLRSCLCSMVPSICPQ